MQRDTHSHTAHTLLPRLGVIINYKGHLNTALHYRDDHITQAAEQLTGGGVAAGHAGQSHAQEGRGRKPRDFIPMLRTARKRKPMHYFWNFTLHIFGPQLTMGN